MSSIVTSFNPTTDTSTSFTAPNAAGNGALVFFNESNISLDLTFADGTSMYLPAWYHRHKCGATGSVNIQWDIHQILNQNNPPISEVVVEAFDAGETFPADGPLVRATNVGNTTPLSSSTTAIANTGNPPGQAIITAQPSDAASATWSADNSGNLVIKGDNAGTLTTLLQLIAGASPAVKLAAASVSTEVLGDLQLDGQLLGPASSDTVVKVASAKQFQVWIGGVEYLLLTTGNLHIDSLGCVCNNLQLPVGRLNAFNTGTVTTSGTVTVTHGLGATPAAVLACVTTSGSSATLSAYSYTSTQFTLLNGSGISMTIRWWAYS
jgi:hypothetical protein